MVDETAEVVVAESRIFAGKQDEVVPRLINRFRRPEALSGMGADHVEETFRVIEEAFGRFQTEVHFFHQSTNEAIVFVREDTIKQGFPNFSIGCCSM